MEAKLTSKGQVTIPKEIRRMLDLDTGDNILFDVHEDGVLINKGERHLTIQERFANYELNASKEDLKKSMKEMDTGENAGEEKS